ncbi:hypothetical protein [Microbispora sp. CSR-4]|uniref:hypothetical protein n=1 Tax=Microbispora sp. CSR-4 TaxID=2592813 RepID=UPI0011C7F384|nr:hypothetical protein [Microbispora sp. CSR-4]
MTMVDRRRRVRPGAGHLPESHAVAAEVDVVAREVTVEVGQQQGDERHEPVVKELLTGWLARTLPATARDAP